MKHQQIQLPQTDLATTHTEIRKLQQENAFLRKQLAPKPSTTDIPPCPSGHTTSPTLSSLPRNHPTPSNCPSSPNNASPPPPKPAKPKHDDSQLRLAAIARQFSSSAEPTSFKLIRVSVRRRLLYNNYALTFVDYTLTPVEFWIFIIQIEIWSASLSILVMTMSSVHN
ncbi:hypothetical protein G6F57_010204 [Rhizopus arrhizus]|nr:hypothetical protein G6F30_010615 [Rhizopus arrhizus]KAG1398243.1 hypothetical protein G6F58_011361 [Rhizopus delemar]KAG0976465.1 hypothetical protein G6F29_010782 [Rhizopus arrhizus]KAG0985517.1 hypothetical protein G6F28_010470 [Rhizopus arrhizus]KAG1003694.1 hypothetical protein G6F27_010814 [Rhizopus arrhizus]